MRSYVRLLGLSVLLTSPIALGGETGPLLVFPDVRVFDGVSVIPRTTVTVQDGVIKSMGDAGHPPEGAEVIDAKGKTLLPGLIDSHVHIIRPEGLSQALVFGVTTELDMFMSHELAATIRSGKVDGSHDPMADFRTAGTAATSPGGHCTEYGLKIPTISKPADARAFVDARIVEGSDYIKIIYDGGGPAGVTKAVLSALIQAAHGRDKMAVVHIGTRKAAAEAIEAGADGLAHVYSHGRPVEGLPGLVARHGAFVVPTLTVTESICGLESGKTLAEDERLSTFLSEIALSNLKASFPIRTDPRYATTVKTAEKAVGLLRSAGVPILAGTDAPNPGTAHGVSLHRELELLVKAGLNPAEALAAATSTPARVFGLADRGRIAPGLRGDLLLVAGDPTADITATRNIVGVWKQGRPVDRKAFKVRLGRDKAAAAKVRKAPAPKGSESGLVSDFEQNRRQKPAARFGFGWMVSTDSVLGGRSAAQMKVVQGGARQSGQSLLITGDVAAGRTVAWAGAMFCPGRWPFAPANLSSFEAISFWARGDGQTYAAMVYAKARGYVPAVKPFSAGRQWKQFTFPMSDFTQTTDGSDITAVLFGRSPEPGKFSLQIDNLRFVPAGEPASPPGRDQAGRQ